MNYNLISKSPNNNVIFIDHFPSNRQVTDIQFIKLFFQIKNGVKFVNFSEKRMHDCVLKF